MMQSAACTAAGSVAALITACGSDGWDGSGTSSPGVGTALATSSNVSVYPGSLTLGDVGAVSLSLIAETTTSNAMLVSLIAAPLLATDNHPLVSTYLTANVPGAVTACVSAVTNRIGTVTGVNAGASIKSVAALRDNTWSVAHDPAAFAIASGHSRRAHRGGPLPRCIGALPIHQ